MKKQSKRSIKAHGHKEERKAEALAILAANNYNWQRTEKETGVSRNTLKRWHSSDDLVCRKMRELNNPPEQKKKEDEAKIQQVKIDAADKAVKHYSEENEGFIKKVFELRNITLERLMLRLIIEKDVYKLTNLFKLTCEILGDIKPLGNDNNTNNFFTQIENLLIQNQHGKSKSIAQGDQPEQVEQ